MTLSRWTRQIHRWLSILFTLATAAVFAALGLGEPAEWVFFLPLPPLFLLLATGLTLFAQPYLARRHSARRATPAE